MKRTVILATVVLFSLGAILYTQVPQLANQEPTVVMKEDSFEPEVLTVKKGTTVTFVNRDKFWHWPASDLHPTHSIYHEFDPIEAIGPEKSWKFVFDKVGTWDYHDHLSPYITGTIIVR